MPRFGFFGAITGGKLAAQRETEVALISAAGRTNLALTMPITARQLVRSLCQWASSGKKSEGLRTWLRGRSSEQAGEPARFGGQVQNRAYLNRRSPAYDLAPWAFSNG